jgi:hypothetical protein
MKKVEKIHNIKLDDGKPPVMTGVFLRFPRAMIAIAEVSAVGFKKYSVDPSDAVQRMGYAEVANGEARYTDAIGRHLLGQVLDGPINIENGTPVRHAAQAAWDALAALEIQLKNEQTKK